MHVLVCRKPGKFGTFPTHTAGERNAGEECGPGRPDIGIGRPQRMFGGQNIGSARDQIRRKSRRNIGNEVTSFQGTACHFSPTIGLLVSSSRAWAAWVMRRL